jgi:hypothetical protein
MARSLVAALGSAALFLSSGCGGNVVVDHGGAGASGQGGSGPGGGSSGNVCEQAEKFIEKCASESTASGTPPTTCSGAVECQSECLVHSTCGALDGSDHAAAATLAQCFAACSGV